jgi:hypothetical protein
MPNFGFYFAIEFAERFFCSTIIWKGFFCSAIARNDFSVQQDSGNSARHKAPAANRPPEDETNDTQLLRSIEMFCLFWRYSLRI